MPQILTNIKQLDLKSSYTYADYLLWQFKDCLELIKGKISKMSPAPNRKRQDISLFKTLILSKFLKNQPCESYIAPFDVRLINFKESTEDNKIIDVVKPGLRVICDSKNLDDKGCIGSPNLIIEILSPGNSNREMDIKLDLYQENCVLENWIVNPSEKNIYIYILENNRYIGLKPLIESSHLLSPTLPKLKFAVKKYLTYNI